MRSCRLLTTLLTLAIAGNARAATPAFRVTARGLATITINGGRARGLKVGDRLSVVVGPRDIGELEVVSAAETSASCRVIAQTRPIGVGDTVVPAVRKASTSRPTDGKAPATAAATPAAAPAAVTARPAPPTKQPPTTSTATVGFAALAPRASEADPPLQKPAPSPPAPVALASSPPAVASAALAPSAAAPAPATPVPATSAPAASAAPTPAAPATTAPATTTPAAPSTGGRRFTVKYRSAANVYLAAGRAEGLNVGDRLRVVGGKDAEADLEVVYAADRSASCRVLSEARPVRAGDEAVVVAAAAGAPPATSVAAASPPSTSTAVAATPALPSPRPAATRAAPWGRLRGAASVGYYRSWDQTEYALDIEERTARLDLGVYDIAGHPLSFTVRGRSRQDIRARTLSARTPQSERNDRLYELALRYEPASDGVAFEVGRIGIYQFVGIGYLDGFLGRFRPLPNVQVGAFGGRVADVYSIGLGGTGQRYGGFVRLAPARRYSAGGYDAMLAFVRENADGDVSREYLSLESRFGGGRWSLFQRAELDLNTGWRKDATGKSTQLSNVSLSGNLRVTSSAWAFVSYDGRRNYRYYTNRVVPEDVFDDLLHQGLRAGINVSRPGGFGATAGFGMSLKESDPNHPELDIADAYSGNAGLRHMDLFSSGFSVGIDGSGFSNGYTTGGMLVARVGRRFAAGHALDFSFGRSLYRMKLTEEDRTTQWLRLMGRAELGWRIYLQGDFEYDSGDDLEGPRGFLELGVLF
jgi:hypothetical protein